VTATRVLVADRRPILLAGLARLLGDDAGLEVVATADSVRSVLAQAESSAADVVVLSLELEGGGVRAIQLLRRTRPALKVVVLSDESDPSWVRSALAAGAHGYLLTRDDPGTLSQAIAAVARGRAWLSVEVTQDLRFLVEGVAERELSAREAEVLVLMALGHTYKVISERLDVSTKTIEGYRTRICERLGLETRADLVRYCLECGYLDPRRALGEGVAGA
jgi:DNA-binding NarL/FixJ family response regulator